MNFILSLLIKTGQLAQSGNVVIPVIFSLKNIHGKVNYRSNFLWLEYNHILLNFYRNVNT